MNICLFTQEEILLPLDLKDARAEHILKVLHKKEGETISAGIIDSVAGSALIKKIDFENKKMYFAFTPYTDERKDGKPLFPLKMIIGFPRPIQLKRLLRDVSGLGVQEVHLCKTELSEKSYLNSKLATSEAGFEMLREGTEQAASTHIPRLYIHASLKDALCFLREHQSGDPPFCAALDNVHAESSLGEALQKNAPITNAIAAIGSERGWTNEERALLERFGYVRLRMGARVLRTETASTVAASLLLNAMGALQ